MLTVFELKHKQSMTNMQSIEISAAGYVVRNCVISCRLKILAASRREKLNDSLTLQQFYRSVDDEESWIKYVCVCLCVLFLEYLVTIVQREKAFGQHRRLWKRSHRCAELIKEAPKV